MSKNKNLGSVGYGNGYVVCEEAPNWIIGKVLTLLDVLGLEEKQDKSIKDLVRQEIWNVFQQGGVFISSERHTQIRDAYWAEMEKSRANKTPMSAI